MASSSLARSLFGDPASLVLRRAPSVALRTLPTDADRGFQGTVIPSLAALPSTYTRPYRPPTHVVVDGKRRTPAADQAFLSPSPTVRGRPAHLRRGQPTGSDTRR